MTDPDARVSTFPKHGTAVVVGPTLDDVRGWPATVAVPAASGALGISPSWGYELIKSGEFPAQVLMIRGRSRVVTASLVRLLEGER